MNTEAQQMSTQQVAQDVALTPAMRHNPTPRTDAILANENDFYAHDTFVRLTKLCRELEVELTEAEQIDNAANHYLSRAEKAEADLATERKKVVDEITEKNAPEIAKVNAHIAAMTARAEKAEAEVAALKRPLLRLTSLWHQLFFLLDITEESDSGNEFRPNYISSCRAVDGERIQKILEEAKQLINTGVKNEHL